MLQCDGKVEDYIDVRLTELQIGWSDLLIMCIIRTSDYEHHADLNRLHKHHISLDVRRLYIQRMDWWGSKSETGRLTGMLETCREYWGLNLSLSLENWENFSIVHAPLTLSAFSRVALWLSMARQGKLWACSGPQDTQKYQFVCSCFSPDTLDLLRCVFSHSSPCLLVPSTQRYTS